MKVELFQVDAFTGVPFRGNPAAVCILSEEGNPEWMQLFAREMNLSETAFVHQTGDDFSLRWFTPTVEVELCGHATLATAHALWQSGKAPGDQPVRFNTLSGQLTANKKDDWIELNFPAAATEPSDMSDYYLDSLGVSPLAILRSGEKFLIEVGDEAEVRALKPDFASLKKLPGRGVVVTAQSERPGIDFVSRYFAPWIGINEDPVTGSAHCILGPYWERKLSKNSMTAYQASERGGVIRVRVSGERVYISGQAVTISRGIVAAVDLG